MNRPTLILVLLVQAAAFIALCVSAARESSCTYDEYGHLAAGYEKFSGADYRFFPESPPLAQMWAALPLRFMDVSAPHRSARGSEWFDSDVWYVGRRWSHQDHDPMKLLVPARLMIATLGLLLGALLVATAWKLAGRSTARRRTAAVAAGVAFTFSPAMIAHASLVTTDFAASLGIFAATLAFAWFLARPGPLRGLVAGVACGAAMMFKFTFLLVVPGLAAASLILALRNLSASSDAAARGSQPALARRVFGALAGTLAAGAAFIFVIWACYGFRYATTPADSGGARPWIIVKPRPADAWAWALEGTGLAGRAVAAVRDARVLPEAFVWGMVYAARSGREFQSYLFGRKHDGATWTYFPVVFLVKTPVPLLLLLAIAAWRSRRRATPAVGRETVAHVPIVAGCVVVSYALLAMAGSYNIGHRHILPIEPFVHLLAALTAARLWHREDRPDASQPPNGPKSARWGPRAAVLGLAAWCVWGVWRTHPHELSFFNDSALDPARAAYIAAGSNLDWGQDMLALARLQRDRGWSEIKLSYVGSGDPAAYGVRATYLLTSWPPESAQPAELTPGVYAFSATTLRMTSFDLRRDKSELEWTPDLAATYRDLCAAIERARSDPARALPRDRQALWSGLRQFKLVTSLRARRPDLIAGGATFVFELDQAELDRILSP